MPPDNCGTQRDLTKYNNLELSATTVAFIGYIFYFILSSRNFPFYSAMRYYSMKKHQRINKRKNGTCRTGDI